MHTVVPSPSVCPSRIFVQDADLIGGGVPIRQAVLRGSSPLLSPSNCRNFRHLKIFAHKKYAGVLFATTAPLYAPRPILFLCDTQALLLFMTPPLNPYAPSHMGSRDGQADERCNKQKKQKEARRWMSPMFPMMREDDAVKEKKDFFYRLAAIWPILIVIGQKNTRE